jgi:hypothetical protein
MFSPAGSIRRFVRPGPITIVESLAGIHPINGLFDSGIVDIAESYQASDNVTG